MTFLEKANYFLEEQGKLKNNKKCGMMIETVKFLLDNAVGIDHAISTTKIITHLNSKGYNRPSAVKIP